MILSTKEFDNIDVGELPKGLYFIKVKNSKGLTGMTKFIKE
jgi:hypothetical protein